MHGRNIGVREAVVMRMAMPQRPGEGRKRSQVAHEQHHHTGPSARSSTGGRYPERE